MVDGDSGVSGCVSATFTSLRPLTEHTAVTFMSDGATLSQVVDCELNTRAYRLAQLKKCFVAGGWGLLNICSILSNSINIRELLRAFV
jgi:hypothetical protein